MDGEMNIKFKNLSRDDKIDIPEGTILEDCNLSQEKSHTKLSCFGKKVTFIRCNLQNVELWPEAKVERCLTFHRDIESIVEVPITAAQRIKELEVEYGVDTIKQVVKNEYKLSDKVGEAKAVINDNIR